MNQPIPRVVISVSGNIGCGKTSLLDSLEVTFGATLGPDLTIIREAVPEWKPFLEQFYLNKEKYALALQLVILHTQSRDKVAADRASKVIITERSPLDSRFVFWELLQQMGIVGQPEIDLYLSAYHSSNWSPEVVIYLKTDPKIVYHRITTRDQAGDSGISLDYLQQLHAQYTTFIAGLSPKIGLIVIDANRPAQEVLSEVTQVVNNLLTNPECQQRYIYDQRQ